MILGLQITAIIFSLTMVYLALLHYKRGEISGLEMAIWLIIWVLTILAVIFPSILRAYTETFAVSRLFDMMVVGGFILVISLSTASYIKSKKLEKKMEDLVRKSTMRNDEKKK